jgi:hypothetical protein
MDGTHAPHTAQSEDLEQDRPESRACVSGVADRAEWRMRMLEQATEAGLDILNEIRRRALAHASVSAEAAQTLAPEGDLGLVYPRIQRAIRQAVALHERFETGFLVRQREAAEEAQRIAASSQSVVDFDIERKKQTVERAVKKAIGSRDHNPRYRERWDLFSDLDDRLEDFDDYDEDGDLPIGAIVESICKVLGLTFDPSLWEHEPWAIAEIKTKPAGSPYADWVTRDDWPDLDLDRDDEDDPYGLAEAPSSGTGPP